MEMIHYEEPQSWDDYGMDWNDPDPRCAHYVMAIRAAFLERAAAAKDGFVSSGWQILKISPWKAVNSDLLRNLVYELEYLCRFYYNLDPYAYKDDFSDFPKRMRFSDIVSSEDCETFLNANRGQILEHGGAWLRKLKNAICKLHVVQCHEAWGTRFSRSGSEHDPPFDESIGKAMEQAFGDNMPAEGRFGSAPPNSIESWSGNNHWKCPRPDWEGDPEDNKDGYCGYAQCSAYKYTRIRRWLNGRECDFVVAVLPKPCSTPTGFSNELATSVFDLGQSGFSEGLNLMRTHVENPLDFEFTVGNIDSLPRNEVVPQSDFDSEGNATWRRSAKRGFTGKMWTFLDYECENGFRFRAGDGAGNTGG